MDPIKKKPTGMPSTRELLHQAIELMRDYPLVSDAQILGMLQATGLPSTLAWEMLTLVPLAYLRVLLRSSGVRFADRFILKAESGEVYSIGLADQAVFELALTCAEETVRAGMPREEIQGLILRSGEFAWINEALRAGVRPQEMDVPEAEIWACPSDRGPLEVNTELETEEAWEELSCSWGAYWGRDCLHHCP